MFLYSKIRPLRTNIYLNTLSLYLPTCCIKTPFSNRPLKPFFFLKNHINHACTNNLLFFSIHLLQTDHTLSKGWVRSQVLRVPASSQTVTISIASRNMHLPPRLGCSPGVQESWVEICGQGDSKQGYKYMNSGQCSARYFDSVVLLY